MNSTQIVRGSINFFIAVCVIITFVQEIWFNPQLTSPQPKT